MLRLTFHRFLKNRPDDRQQRQGGTRKKYDGKHRIGKDGWLERQKNAGRDRRVNAITEKVVEQSRQQAQMEGGEED